MFRTLRSRLILSQVVPLLILLPLMGIILAYVLETQVLLPRLARNLEGDSLLLAEVCQANIPLWGDTYFFESIVERAYLDPSVQVMFYDPVGQLLYSSRSNETSENVLALSSEGVSLVRSGQEVVLTNYSVLRLHNILVDIMAPVIGPGQRLIGIVRLVYRLTTPYELFSQMRILIAAVVFLELLLGVLLGSMLAVNIGQPVQQVTQAIYDLAQGHRREPLQEQGPQEIRAQVQAVNYLVEQLRSLEQARRQLLANLVHELGRPLGALRSAIHALSKGAANDPQLFADLTHGMDEETSRLQHVLDDLAHLYDQVLGPLELKREPVKLNEWLVTVLSPWQEAAQEKRLTWRADIPQDLPTVFIDPMRLGQVIGNLTSNAVKYTPSGRSVSVNAGQQGNEIWIRISDTGPGISPEEQEKIFTPFYRGAQIQRIKQGMGLGLSIARDLTVAHGGRLEVKSTPGLGSQFTIWIPIGEPSKGV